MSAGDDCITHEATRASPAHPEILSCENTPLNLFLMQTHGHRDETPCGSQTLPSIDETIISSLTDDSFTQIRWPRRSSKRSSILKFATIIFSGAIFGAAVFYSIRRSAPLRENIFTGAMFVVPGGKQGEQPELVIEESESALSCGSTRTEAVSMGCVMDIMSVAWLPPACYNSQLSQRALAPDTILATLGGAGPNDWFLDDEHTQRISAQSLKDLDSLVAYTAQSYHLAHCIYSWQTIANLMNRVMQGETPVYVYSKLLDEEHIHHCSMVIAANHKLRHTNVSVTFSLGTCTRLDSFVR